MDKAIVGVCHDRRQRKILDVTFPSWRAYAHRHGLPIHIIEHSYAGANFYWTKHRLFRAPELQSYEYLLFLDNDVFLGADSPPLLNHWDSPLIGATFESTQAAWSREAINRYYDSYGVDRPTPITELGVINTGVLVIPREQAQFLESVYVAWTGRIGALAKSLSERQAPFALEADQPHISYALQARARFSDFGEKFNMLWWHWYSNNVSQHRSAFLLRSKAAELTLNVLPRKLWQTIFRRERALFAAARKQCEFLHVAGSKSAIFLGTESRAQIPNRG